MRRVKIPRNVGYSQAHVMATFWYNRWRDLPRWRVFAKREARSCANEWGEFLKALQAERDLLVSNDVQPSNHSPRTG